MQPGAAGWPGRSDHPRLRNASSTTRALAGGGKILFETPLPVPEPPDPVLGGLSAADAPAPVAPTARPGEAEELLDDLLIADRKRAGLAVCHRDFGID